LGGGNDIFNGGDGSDRVFGGSGNDILTGGGSNNIFVLSTTGTDTITDFIDGEDLLGLCDIFFEQLTITQGTGTNQNDTLISLSSSAETLAILQNVSSSSIDSADFIMV
jgi:Ca2+-binding RTX toxin-like protein